MEQLPTAETIEAHLPPDVRAEVLGEELRRVVTRAADLARKQTDGRGFSLDGLCADRRLTTLIRNSVVRALTNPEISLTCSAPLFVAAPGSFGDWTLEELDTLSQFRHGGSTPASHPTEAPHRSRS